MRAGWLLILPGLMLPAVGRATSAVTISPAAHEVILETGDVEKTVSFEIANQTPEELTVGLKMADFGSLDETGGIAFLGDQNDDWQHRLASWLTLDRDQLRLAAGQSASVTVHIHNRDDLTPGGHYAAVLATVQDPGSRLSVQKSSASWQGVMSSQFYVLKRGGERYQIEVLDLFPSGLVWRWPTKVEVRLRAGGNTHVKPHGTITTSFGGKTVARGILNQDSALILPGATRVLTADLTNPGWRWPGRYQLILRASDQMNQSQVEAERVIWFAPWWLVLVIILALFIWRRRRG